ncbi:hypothetical protein VOLCADRAFT_97169 [Volvox carteri f. nagariensis]|uniref:PCI domain-containing protein n=1 Tax=Volvox carteri f. nagariensis TaxID=3068 RepID=D8UC22_VOLCA|nr:uncharacterized protein VOLCADRAFT_97169 [Volvox carteri f. nagariensis]EFJ42771.1 hypothetical protein VOLCADRAFT_97169 [Volvox carteri f. nagariensis]|eukprot:XP_002956232.1 hypothetical protein VOLCADRAFT_97169 [Volvox carteri f. nagariensis]
MLASSGRAVPTGQLSSQLPEPWGDMVAAFMRCQVAQNNGERAVACREYREGYATSLASLLNADKGTETEWLIPLALGAAAYLKVLSSLADEELARKGAAANQLSECAISLQNFFRGLATSKSSQAKKDASVAVVCVMMKVYFKLNAINNCKQPLQQIELNRLFDNAKQAHKVTLRYYTGRLAAYDEDFQKADEHLTYAFEHCASSSPHNVRRVLRYLIPVKMLLGVLPSEALLRQYGLSEYEPIRRAVKEGSLGLLLSSLESNQIRFIQSGTFLLLERLQLVVVRRLFRKVALVHAQMNPAKAHQVPLALLEAALQLQGIEKDPLELQCLIANLIFRKYIKGYLAYKSRVVVLAKTDAFPVLSAVQLSDPLAT